MEMRIPEVEALTKEISGNRELFEFAMTMCAPKLTVTVKDIARKEGCSVSALGSGGRERYLLPRFGESGYPDGPRRWDIFEYWKWRQIPQEERKRMWKEYLMHQKERKDDSHIARA